LVKGYLQANLEEESKYLTTFITDFGLYEFNRVPFGLKTAVSYFQRLMSQEVLDGLIGKICEAYIDDIIVYASTEEGLMERIGTVLDRLRKHNFKVNLKKCKFGVSNLEFLGYIISKEGTSLSESKKKGLIEMKRPENIVSLRSFLGVANHFSSFIPNLAMKAGILFGLTSKGVHWVWDENCEEAFQYIKEAIICAGMLYHIDYDLPLVFRSDASEVGVGGALFNIAPDGTFRYIAFVSRKFSGSAVNWSVIDKEAYAIFYGITSLDYYLRGRPFLVECDHKNIAYIRNNPEQKGRVARMDAALREYIYQVAYIPGKDNGIADALSRCLTSVLLPDGTITESNVKDIIASQHNAIEGHHGMNYTVKQLIQKGFRWQSLRRDVVDFIQNCPWCLKDGKPKLDNRIPEGKVIESYIPFYEISVDSIVKIPPDADGNQHILVFIDSFSRFVELYALKDLSAEGYLGALIDFISRYGIPKAIRSDMGKQFRNEIMKEMERMMDTKHLFTIGYRSQANGVVERCNKSIMQHLRAIVNDRNVCKRKWAMVLPLVQRIINATVHTSLGVAPRELIFGTRLALERDIFDGNTRWKVTTDNYIKELNDSLEEVVAASQRHLAKVLDKRANLDVNSLGNYKQFQPRDYVVIEKYGETPGVLNAHYKGPYLVVERRNINNYLLRDLESNREFLVHVDKMRKFTDRLSEKEVQTLSNKDKDENLVISVLSHRVIVTNDNPNYKKKKDVSLELEYDTGEKQFLPYPECKHVEAVKKYIKEHEALHYLLT
jgi:hypothetical protein